MTTGSIFRRTVRRFCRDRRGNYGMMMAALAPLLLLGVGFGINIAQVSTARSNLLAALNSAVTSTARDITVGVIEPENAEPTIEAFLIANGQRAFSQGDRITLEKVVIDKFRKTVAAEASVVVDVAFPLFGASNRQRISTELVAMYSDRKIEVVMVLDVTGSMQGNKIKSLQSSATTAVEALLSGNKHSPDRVRISLVPYAEAVNVGAALAKATVYQEGKNGPNVPPPGWKSPSKLDDNCATERKLENGSPDFSDDGPDKQVLNKDNKYYYKLVNRDYDLKTSACPSASVVPLTTDEAKLKKAIEAFKASGMTAGGIATQWGYYMLSPNWRKAISDAGLGAGPADHDPEKVGKIAILMTDGAFNTVYAGSNSSNNARSLCTRMKQDGIEVFTIGFALPASQSSEARKVLKDCASPDTALTKHFYDAATGDELRKAFNDIVRNIEQLALIR